MLTHSITYTVRAHDGLPAVRFDVDVFVVGGAPRVTLLKNGATWCEEVSVPEALESVSYLSLPKSRKATLHSKIDQTQRHPSTEPRWLCAQVRDVWSLEPVSGYTPFAAGHGYVKRSACSWPCLAVNDQVVRALELAHEFGNVLIGEKASVDGVAIEIGWVGHRSIT